jgi:hypothetical protein
MEKQVREVVGIRRTGWAALDRDPQQDVIDYSCPHCGVASQKKARHERTEYRFTDGFMQDLQGEGIQCHFCKQSLRVVPVILIHYNEEKRRFDAMFATELATEVASEVATEEESLVAVAVAATAK